MANRKLFVAVLSGLLAVSLVRCGATRDDVEDPPDDPVPGKDASTVPPADTGVLPGPDAGSVDTGPKPAQEFTVPQLNNKDAAGHPAVDAAVLVKAVTVSKRWRVSKNTSGTDPKYWSCLYGVFVADPAAVSAEYNGILVTSESTVDGTTKNCNTDSDFPGSLENEGSIGTEIEVTGWYKEFCGNSADKGVTCKDKDSAGRELRMPQIKAKLKGVVLGSVKGVPASLPGVATVEEIKSGRGCQPAGGYAMGSQYWKYRSVLVKVANVHPVSFNPDAAAECAGGSTGDFCEWRVAPAGVTDPDQSIRVDDGVDFQGTDCKNRPKTDVAFSQLRGVLYWSYGNAKLLPTRKADATPPLPGM